MRELKFRAWDKDSQKMCVVGQIQWLGEDIDHVLRDRSRGWTNDYISNYELMQYTGLKDKNGKEIYEGDIGETYSSGFMRWGRSPKGVVIYENGKFTIRECEWGMNGTPWGAVTIIGNIYENPELII